MPKYAHSQEDQYDAGFGKTYNPVDAPLSDDHRNLKSCTGCAFRPLIAACFHAPACDAATRLDKRAIIWVAA